MCAITPLKLQRLRALAACAHTHRVGNAHDLGTHLAKEASRCVRMSGAAGTHAAGARTAERLRTALRLGRSTKLCLTPVITHVCITPSYHACLKTAHFEHVFRVPSPKVASDAQTRRPMFGVLTAVVLDTGDDRRTGLRPPHGHSRRRRSHVHRPPLTGFCISITSCSNFMLGRMI